MAALEYFLQITLASSHVTLAVLLKTRHPIPMKEASSHPPGQSPELSLRVFLSAVLDSETASAGKLESNRMENIVTSAIMLQMRLESFVLSF